MDATSLIIDELREYEDEYGVTLLAAKEYGSRARGLEDSSSDYDVFFIFVEDPLEYATPGGGMETINRQSPDIPIDAEIHGWSLKKFAGYDTGLMNSNPTALEFCASDEVHYINDEIETQWSELEELALSSFKPLALIMHYRSMAISNYKKNLNAERDCLDANVKDTLKILRAFFNSIYIRETHEMPPMNFTETVDSVAELPQVPDSVVSDVRFLTRLKQSGDGDKYVGERISSRGEPRRDFIERMCGQEITHEEHLTQNIEDTKLNRVLKLIITDSKRQSNLSV